MSSQSCLLPLGRLNLGCFVVFVFLSSYTSAQDADLEFEQQVAKVTQAASQSIIGLEFIGGSGKVDGAKKSRGPGTGVVVDEKGWLMTAAYHVADQPTSIVATLPNGKRTPAEIVATDHARNIVLLKMTTNENLVVPTFIGRNELSVGQTVIALGKGFDVSSVQVSTGVLSATNRVWGKAIQTDAKISPANYGGPLLNLRGQMIGMLAPLSPRGEKIMNGSEWYDSGIGFAVPLEELIERLDKLKSGQDQLPGKLGVAFRGTDIYVDNCEVAFCTGGSPAGKAGIRPGDEIVSFNGLKTPRQAAFRHAIGPAYAGDTVQITIVRNGKIKNLQSVLAAELPLYEPVAIGIALGPSFDSNKMPPTDSLRVRQVQTKGAAELAGIKVGDQIVAANGVAIGNPDALRAQIAATAIGKQIALTVVRDGQRNKFEIAVEDRQANIPKSNDPSRESVIDSTAYELKVAEAPNTCFVIAPKQITTPTSLVVWLAVPGKLDLDAIKTKWANACTSNQSTLLVVGAADEKKWTPEESTVVMRAIATLSKSRKLDRRRVVVGGTGAGGTMASLVCFGQPRVFQGLVLDSTVASNQLPEIVSSPVAPMMVLVSGARGRRSVEISLLPIQKSKTPIERTEDVSPDDVFRWGNFVDRL